MNVLILAAGSPVHAQPETTREAWLLMSLGDRKLIDYVMDLAREVATPDEIFVVVNDADGEVARHLGATFRYVVQERAQGTGHAVHQAAAALAEATGPLVILYGDTPLIRKSSIRGLITRHTHKGAALTLLSARTALPLSYGQVTRDRSGRIVAVIDEAGDAGSPANAHVALRELNIGAYVADPALLWPALAELARTRPQDLHLTDVVAVLVRQNKVVEAYRALDADEVRGVNTSDDLTQAEVTLQKRQLRPRRNQERNLIRFGTGGWRALIGEGFTLDNVRRLCQALANDILRNGREQAGVLIGYDRRFLGEEAATAAAEIFAANNIPVDLLAEAVPTPLVTYATAARTYAYGLIFTASHNPAQWNGLKVFASDGSLPMDDQTYRIAAEANALTPGQVVKVELETARNAGLVQTADYTNQYVDAVEKLIDLQAIRRAGLRVAIDPMYGVGQVTLEIILTEARCRLTTIHSRHDPLFGGRSPAPDHGELNLLINTVCEGGYDLGLAMDGDADRIAIIDDQGTFITTNQLLLLLYYYLHAVRRERGGVTRNLATTHLLDRLAAHFGEECHEVPVGFKHLAASMKEHNVLLAGESSGGLSIRGHILGKDGIFACALVVEMMARTGSPISTMLEEIYAITGRKVSREVNLPATSEMKVLTPRKLAHLELTELAGLPVQRISHADGTKFYLADDNWLLLRFSGTEPLLRIFAEAENDAQADALIQWARNLITR